jgi:hypothetical protein
LAARAQKVHASSQGESQSPPQADPRYSVPSKAEEDTTTEASDERDETYQSEESDVAEESAERTESGELKETIVIHGCTRHGSGFAFVVSFGRDPRVFAVLPNALPSKYNEDVIDYYESHLRFE